MREVFLLFLVLLTALHLAIAEHRFERERKVVETRVDLQRLAQITLEYFRGREPPTGAAFWQAIGRPEGSPIYDVWGQEYRMEIFPGDPYREYIWTSSGPDRVRGTKDDIKARVPFQRGNPDLTQPGISPGTGPTSTDAK